VFSHITTTAHVSFLYFCRVQYCTPSYSIVSRTLLTRCMYFCSDYNSTQNTFAAMSKSSTSRKSRKNSDGEDNYRYQTVTHFSPILAMGLPPCPPVAQSPVDQGNSALSKVILSTLFVVLLLFSSPCGVMVKLGCLQFRGLRLGGKIILYFLLPVLTQNHMVLTLA